MEKDSCLTIANAFSLQNALYAVCKEQLFFNITATSGICQSVSFELFRQFSIIRPIHLTTQGHECSCLIHKFAAVGATGTGHDCVDAMVTLLVFKNPYVGIIVLASVFVILAIFERRYQSVQLKVAKA
jgi:hypothetical protein